MRYAAIACLVVWATAQAAPAAALTDYELLAGWDDLALDKTDLTAGLASSYDRTGGNGDFNWYESSGSTQTNTYVSTVIADIAGPGILTRLWMPHATANWPFPITITVDGVPSLVTDSAALLGGTYAYGQAPLVYTLVGGQVSYEPIAFQSSLKIETMNYDWGNFISMHDYYQYNYVRLPAGTIVTPYGGTLTAAQQAARATVAGMLSAVGSNPSGLLSGATVLATPGQAIAAGTSLALGGLTGSGTVRQLNLKLPAGVTDASLDGLRLRICYDAETGYAVDVPVSQFFGAGHGRAAYQSLPMGTDSPDGYYCYFPMPFRHGATVELYNASGAAVSIQSASLTYTPGAPAPDAFYFRTSYQSEVTATGQAFHTLLSVSGQGHYVGNLLYVSAPGDRREALEGDDIITVNPGTPGETVLHGTGLEDAYNGGYYYNHVNGLEQTGQGDVKDPSSGAGAYSGLLALELYDTPGFQNTRADQYRWMIGDCVPFTSGLDVKIETDPHVTGYTPGGDTYASTALYYSTPQAASLTWSGAGGSGWNVADAANWSMSGQRTTFWQGDLVRFDDTGAAGTVELTSAVSPGAVVVDNAAVSYVLNGSGSLTGAMTLTKRGAGTLVLATANAYTGDTQILGGTVIAAAGYALGSGPSTVRLGATSGSDSAALLVSGAVVVDRPIVVQGDGSGTSTRTLGGTHTAGAAVFSGGVTVLADLTLVAAEGGEVDLTGPLDDLAGKAIAKTGAGVLVLGGTQSYGLGAVLNVEEGAIFMSTDGGAEATADLAVNVGGAGTDAAITFGSDQHLAMLHIMAGGVARLGDGCRVLELDSLWIDAFGPPLTNIRLVNAPEPATLALLGLGGAALLVRRFGRGRVRFPAIR